VRTFQADNYIFTCDVMCNGLGIIAGTGDGALNLWDIESQKLKMCFEGRDGPTYCCADLQDRSILVSSSGDILKL